MADLQKGYRIRAWNDFYEPPKRENWGDGALKFVKLRVFAPKIGPGYTDLLENGKTNELAAFGLFCKLLELAANQPRGRRDGTIYNHRGELADHKYIARVCLVTPATAKKLLDLLTSERVGWVEMTTAERRTGDAEPTSKRRTGDGQVTDKRRPDDGDITLTETEQETLTKTETGGVVATTPPVKSRPPPNALSRSSVSGNGQKDRSSVSGSEKTAEDDPTLADEAFRTIAARQAAREISKLVANLSDKRQTRGDAVTLANITRHYFNDPTTRGECRRLYREMMDLAREKRASSLNNKMAGFVKTCKERWGAWPELQQRQAVG